MCCFFFSSSIHFFPLYFIISQAPFIPKTKESGGGRQLLVIGSVWVIRIIGVQFCYYFLESVKALRFMNDLSLKNDSVHKTCAWIQGKSHKGTKSKVIQKSNWQLDDVVILSRS